MEELEGQTLLGPEVLGIWREGRISGLQKGDGWGVTPGLGEPELPKGRVGSPVARRGGLFHTWAAPAEVSS